MDVHPLRIYIDSNLGQRKATETRWATCKADSPSQKSIDWRVAIEHFGGLGMFFVCFPHFSDFCAPVRFADSRLKPWRSHCTLARWGTSSLARVSEAVAVGQKPIFAWDWPGWPWRPFMGKFATMAHQASFDHGALNDGTKPLQV